MTVMCDSKNLNWCGRISLLLTICTILCVMMFQIWTYYFSLVSQMDEMVLESPQVHGVLDVCRQQVRRNWNVEDCLFASDTTTCALGPGDVYVDYVGTGSVVVNATHFVLDAGACGRAMLWILPW